MLLALLAAIALFLIWLALRSRGTPSRLDSEMYVSPDAKTILDTIKSKADYKKLTQKIERLESKSYRSDKAEEKAHRELEILQEAENAAMTKTIAWQLVTAETIDVPRRVLEYGYKVFELDAHERALTFLGVSPASRWVGLDPYSDPEPVPLSLEVMKQFRTIVEGSASTTDKVKAIDKLYSSRPDEFENLLIPSSSLTAGQEWVAHELSAKGVPKAKMLVADGVLTVEDVLRIDPREFAGRKGVGPKTIADFIAFQKTALSEMQ